MRLSNGFYIRSREVKKKKKKWCGNWSTCMHLFSVQLLKKKKKKPWFV